MKDSPHLHPGGVGVRVSASFGGDQKPLRLLAFLAHVLGVVMGVSQHEARLIGQLFDQRRSYLVVCHVVGRGEAGRQRGIHTEETVMARCSFHPYTHPCQPLLVQAASVSMEV